MILQHFQILKERLLNRGGKVLSFSNGYKIERFKKAIVLKKAW